MIYDLVTRMFRTKREPLWQALTSAQAQSLFVPSMLSAATRRIDPPKASLQEIEDAVKDCQFYWHNAYPETENELVEWIEEACRIEINRRLSGTLHDTMIRRLWG